MTDLGPSSLRSTYQWYKINKHRVFRKQQKLFYHKNLKLPLVIPVLIIRLFGLFRVLFRFAFSE